MASVYMWAAARTAAVAGRCVPCRLSALFGRSGAAQRRGSVSRENGAFRQNQRFMAARWQCKRVRGWRAVHSPSKRSRSMKRVARLGQEGKSGAAAGMGGRGARQRDLHAKLIEGGCFPAGALPLPSVRVDANPALDGHLQGRRAGAPVRSTACTQVAELPSARSSSPGWRAAQKPNLQTQQTAWMVVLKTCPCSASRRVRQHEFPSNQPIMKAGDQL